MAPLDRLPNRPPSSRPDTCVAALATPLSCAPCGNDALIIYHFLVSPAPCMPALGMAPHFPSRCQRTLVLHPPVTTYPHKLHITSHSMPAFLYALQAQQKPCGQQLVNRTHAAPAGRR